MAPTGAVADNIGGSTIHTVLSISVLNEKGCQKQKEKNQQLEPLSFYIRNLWKAKSIMIINEISLLSADWLYWIDTWCQKLRASSDIFGGILIVILMGDFFQFPSVAGKPFWSASFINCTQVVKGCVI